jgi:hypothetical protein
MRRLVWTAAALAAFAALPRTTDAHFVWIQAEPHASPAVVRVTFGELPDAGEPGLAARIAKTELFAHGASFRAEPAEDGLEARLPTPCPAAIDAVCDYGVVTRQGATFLLQYTARTQTRPEAADDASSPLREHPRLVWLAAGDGQPVVQALWRGKPVAGAVVKVFEPEGEPREVRSEADGRVPVALSSGVSLLLRVVEERPGQRDGRDYREIRHYATLTLSQDDPGASQEGPSADEVLRRAHEARACWGPDFPGFTAELTVRVDDDEVRGTVEVAPDGTVEAALPDGPAKDWARTQLRSIVMHRGLSGPTELEPGAKYLEPASAHPLGRLIQLADDRMGSAYRIKGDEILEVNRVMKEKRFSNRILANTRNAEGKLLPLAYTVSYWDNNTGQLDRVEAFHATWTRVGHLDLPKTHTQIRASDGKSSVRQLELSAHRLRNAPATTAGAR